MVLSGNAPSGATVLRVSTDAMPARDRVAIWREEFARNFLHLDIEPRDPGQFRADATIRVLPGLTVASCETSASVWRRTRGMIEPGPEEIGIVFGWRGAATFSQRGHSFELGPGDAAVSLNSEPADLTLPRAIGRHVGLIVPRALLAALLADGEPAPRYVACNNEALRLLSGYLGSLSDRVTLASPELCQAFATHVRDLIALALGASRDGNELATRRGLRAARLRAIKADIRDHLASAECSVAAVARRQGVTPRYLHMLFEGEGNTFSQFVLGERLELVRQMLADPGHDHQSIAAIAYSAGFGDLSYFNRAFRTRYGMTPGDVRRYGSH